MKNFALEALLRNIVQAEMPEELEVFDLSVQTLIARAHNVENIKDLAHSESFSFEFGDGAVTTMEFIALLWGTIKAIEGIADMLLPGAPTIDSLKEKWRVELRKAGLSKSKVERIVEGFASDLRDYTKN